MAGFYGTYENKVDAKGRVSVPAVFRQILAGPSFAAFPSHRVEAIEGFSIDFMDHLSARVSEIDFFSQDDLSMTVFSDSQQLTFDSTGRVQLPEGFRSHAGITDRAAFVGLGPTFQIWEPARLARHKVEARQRARDKRLTIPAPGSSGGGR